MFSPTLARVCAGCIVALGCGSHDNDEIPAGLLEAIAGRDVDSADYPKGPYGSDVGDTAENVCIQGWRDPTGAGFDASKLETLCFADYWDPNAKDESLLLVNTSALWCTACRSEYGGTQSRPSLGRAVAERSDRGLHMLGVLFQDAERNPANAADATLWAQTFGVDFPFGYDAPFAMGAFASASIQPFNMLIDARTMTVVLTLQGDDPETLWPAIDARLSP